MQSNSSMYLYVVKLTLVIGAVLAGFSNVMESRTTGNRELAKKAAILSCVERDAQDIEGIFNSRIKIKAYHPGTDVVFDSLTAELKKDRPYKSLADIDLGVEEKLPEDKRIYPIYEYKGADNKIINILAVRGNGLWDKIWAYVAVDETMAIKGVYFDHKAETPGLGAEIKDSKKFKDQFNNPPQPLKLYDEAGNLVSITVKKRSVKKPAHEVYGIAGATITSDGVTEMLQRGVKYYEKFLAKARTGGGGEKKETKSIGMNQNQ